MKAVNLFSLTWNHASSPIQAKKYLALNGIKMREYEFNSLIKFVHEIYEYETSSDLQYLDNYYVSYVIPQIRKEFDLLRFGKNYNINIELKSANTGQAITEQLIKNRYYLRALEKDAYYFTYVSSEKKLYQLIEGDIQEVSISSLCKLIKQQDIQRIDNIDALFEPTNYLISPFNSTNRFIQDEYFLTEQQVNIRKACIEGIKTKGTFFSIEGSAGTGKTLLTYDIAKVLLQNEYKIILIHCGILNRGHYQLIAQGWDIQPIKCINSINLLDYDIIVLDEAQRIYLHQLNYLIRKAQENKISCIFSYDARQYLGGKEDSKSARSIIHDKTDKINRFQLTEKIRSNEEIASFIRYFFRPKKQIIKNSIRYKNIQLHHFEDNFTANCFAQYLIDNEWVCINYTPPLFGKSSFKDLLVTNKDKGVVGNAHEVIGQEFDNIVLLIDKNFYYQDNKLRYKGESHYFADKMLFQMMTRARKKLSIILVDNEEIYTRCIDILSSS